MVAVVTLSERKDAEARRREAAVEALRSRLALYAASRGGRYLLFGSAARGEMRYDSDVDLIVDFPDGAVSDAWRFAEEECGKLDLVADVRPLVYCKTTFLSFISRDVRVLG